MKRVPHTINGKPFGMFYHLDDGRVIYMAHRRARDVERTKNAWCIDVSVLEEARKLGASAVGVMCGKGKSKKFWLTSIQDFFESRHSFAHWGTAPQRGLPLTRFIVNPHASRDYVTSAVKIR